MLNIKWLLASGFALSLATQSALADFYVRGTGGLSTPDEDELDNALGMSAQAGYQINKYFAVQGGATYLGSFGFEEELEVEGLDEEGTMSIYGAEATLVASGPVSEKFSLYGKAGIFAWEFEAEITASSGNTEFSETETIDGTDAAYGIGGEYMLSPRLSIIGEANFYDIDVADVNYFGGGVKFTF